MQLSLILKFPIKNQQNKIFKLPEYLTQLTQNAIHKAREIGNLNAQRQSPRCVCEKSVLMSQNPYENASTGVFSNKVQTVGQ